MGFFRDDSLQNISEPQAWATRFCSRSNTVWLDIEAEVRHDAIFRSMFLKKQGSRLGVRLPVGLAPLTKFEKKSRDSILSCWHDRAFCPLDYEKNQRPIKTFFLMLVLLTLCNSYALNTGRIYSTPGQMAEEQFF